MTALHDKMDRNDLIALLPEDSLFTRNLHTADRVDSTNTRLKELAAQDPAYLALGPLFNKGRRDPAGEKASFPG